MENLNKLLANPDPTIANAIGAKDKLTGILEEIKLKDPQFYMTLQSGNHEARLEGLQKEMIRMNEQMLATNINTNDVNAFIVDVNSFVNKYIDEKDVSEDVLYTYEKLDTALANFLARPDISKQQKDRLRALIPKLNEVVKSSIMEGRMESEADYLARIKAGREEELANIASMGSVKDIIELHEKLTKSSGSVEADEEIARLKSGHLDELRELSRVVKGSDRKTINDMISELLSKPRVPPLESPTEEKVATPKSESSVSISEESPRGVTKEEQMLQGYKDIVDKLSTDGQKFLANKLRSGGLKGSMKDMITIIVNSGDLEQLNTLDEFIGEASKFKGSEPEEKEFNLSGEPLELYGDLVTEISRNDASRKAILKVLNSDKFVDEKGKKLFPNSNLKDMNEFEKRFKKSIELGQYESMRSFLSVAGFEELLPKRSVKTESKVKREKKLKKSP